MYKCAVGPSEVVISCFLFFFFKSKIQKVVSHLQVVWLLFLFFKTNSDLLLFINLFDISGVGSGFEYFYCYVNKLKLSRPNTINFVENGFKNWALVRIATTGHNRK